MTEKIKQCYRQLELEPGASLVEVKAAWREWVKVWHPDRFGDDVKLKLRGAEKLKEINAAYAILEDHLMNEPGIRSAQSESRPGSGQDKAPSGAAASNDGPPTTDKPGMRPKQRRPFGAILVALVMGGLGLAVMNRFKSSQLEQRGAVGGRAAVAEGALVKDPVEDRVAELAVPERQATVTSETASANAVAVSLERVGSVEGVDQRSRRAESGDPAGTFAWLGFKMIFVPGGTFVMGSDREGYTHERPLTKVTLSPFWMASTEVTQAQWRAVMRTGPAFFKGPNLPVEQVSWLEAMDFCRKLTEREQKAGRLPLSEKYTLPTEAQFEYVCRAGSLGGHSGDVEKVAWYKVNSSAQTHPVGTKAPNAWGFYDLHGNLWEWVIDRYGTYAGGSVTDPLGATEGKNRSLRGGSWSSQSFSTRSSVRISGSPGSRSSSIGFRPVRVGISQ